MKASAADTFLMAVRAALRATPRPDRIAGVVLTEAERDLAGAGCHIQPKDPQAMPQCTVHQSPAADLRSCHVVDVQFKHVVAAREDATVAVVRDILAALPTFSVPAGHAGGAPEHSYTVRMVSIRDLRVGLAQVSRTVR